jgi:hypothetical protein
MPKRQPCIECRVLPKWGTRHRCRACYFRHQPIGERIAEARRRLEMVPVELRQSRVPEKEWPAGKRWCAGCQSFVPLEDTRGSRCIPCASASQHGAMIAKTYGIDAAEYDRLLALQDGKCAICRARPKKKRLAVDHSHKSGAVRGLLCSRCNHDLLGAGWDSGAMLLAAWHYLNTPPTSGVWVNPERGLVAPSTVAAEDEPVVADPAGSGTRGTPKASTGRTAPLPPGVEHVYCGDPTHLVALGSAKDEHGFYRLYAAAGDERPPF